MEKVTILYMTSPVSPLVDMCVCKSNVTVYDDTDEGSSFTVTYCILQLLQALLEF